MKLFEILKRLKSAYSSLKFGGNVSINISNIEYKDILLGKKVLITGGGSGIGFAIAKKSVALGATVIITGRNEEKLKNALTQINNPNISYVVWDISDIKIMKNKIAECLEKFKSDIDIVICNAGVQPNEFFGNVSEQEWDRVYSTNSKAVYFLNQEICNIWQRSNFVSYRKIINISSQGGFVGAGYPYRMSKWDVRGMTEGIAKLVVNKRILVNGIAPGIVKTNMQHFALEQGDNYFCDQNPMKRVSLPEEIAELAVFMMSDACNFLVGQTILIDGGFCLK